MKCFCFSGLRKESQKKLDQCTPVSVKIIRLAKAVNEIQERDKKMTLASIEASENTKIKFRLITVHVELHDFKIHQDAIKDYIDKNNLKVSL